MNDIDKSFHRNYEEAGPTSGMSPRRWWWRLLVGVIAFATSCFLLLGVQLAGLQKIRITSSEMHSIAIENHKNNVTILLWTSFFDDWDYLNPGNHTCPVTCEVTSNRSRLKDSQALIFHSRDMNMGDLPQLRLPNQQWIFYCLESPAYSYFAGFHHMNNMFNWTMTYRKDSDIIIPYGFIHKKKNPTQSNEARRLKAIKRKSTFWLVSHCKTAGGREDFAKELAKWTQVDVYGSCGSKPCKRDKNNSCFQKLSMQYKFILAFENSLCKNYATEKFYTALQYDVVPIVFGSAEYASIAPPNSFIDALSFPSPRHLAEHLERVDKNDTLYESYLMWKNYYDVELLHGQTLCRLCQKMHNPTNLRYSYNDMNSWWVEKGHCYKWAPT